MSSQSDEDRRESASEAKKRGKHDRAVAWSQRGLCVAYAVLALLVANDAWELGTESGALIRWLLAVLLVLFAIQKFRARAKWAT